MAKVSVLYYSSCGHVGSLAHGIAEGVRPAGASVDIKRVPETLPVDVASVLDQAGGLWRKDALKGKVGVPSHRQPLSTADKR